MPVYVPWTPFTLRRLSETGKENLLTKVIDYEADIKSGENAENTFSLTAIIGHPEEMTNVFSIRRKRGTMRKGSAILRRVFPCRKTVVLGSCFEIFFRVSVLFNCRREIVAVSEVINCRLHDISQKTQWENKYSITNRVAKVIPDGTALETGRGSNESN
ncbi:hypothetical protein WA026_000157 [Henosepilachna vigintioctopunctata]|uniref:Uncharacterized protein n=1 Tax=Henosepilachna vigintioctopunctata TaxID=420089 RepID=A0AAW1V2Z5_9CUCU